VSPDRLVFAPRVQPDAHIARQRLADLFLDTMPCNGHTTASEALFIGLPLVTMLGETFAGRVAASLLSAAGLPELIAKSETEYEALALRLARDPALLQSFKRRLAETRDTTPLFDTERFARHLERAYLRMAERSRRGEPPAAFAVPRLP
jgi:predicted O-linked N-acetylglucosamine transferase (SPINDLY family)